MYRLKHIRCSVNLHRVSRRLICRLILSIMIGGISFPMQAHAASGRILGSLTDQKGRGY